MNENKIHSSVVRFSVSLSEELLSRFDELLTEKGYQNRSEGIRDLIRNEMVNRDIIENREIVGVITLVYDHHVRELTERLIQEQHKSKAEIISSMHIHLDHHNCLEIVVARGMGDVVQQFADRIIGTRGVIHGKLIVTTTGSDIPR
ncbi:MAG: nickel-responsive transcriptional regulator NikR [bacterium]|jgi:CopG family nickel-responsive transcriptional regulator|nr:nickel-responsive transcriptional regulator NikR [bacterium]